MKKFLALTTITVLFAACSHEAQRSATNGVPGSPVLEPPIRLGCVETQTFYDAPGYEHKMTIRQALQTATVDRRSVSMAGYVAWEVGQLPYAVQETYSDAGELTLALEEMVDTNVDWATEGGCYKFVPQQSFTVTRAADGSWKGTAQLIPNTLLNPAVTDCSYPMPALPPQYQLACSEIQ
jgi:hypothetical protein